MSTTSYLCRSKAWEGSQRQQLRSEDQGTLAQRLGLDDSPCSPPQPPSLTLPVAPGGPPSLAEQRKIPMQPAREPLTHKEASLMLATVCCIIIWDLNEIGLPSPRVTCTSAIPAGAKTSTVPTKLSCQGSDQAPRGPFPVTIAFKDRKSL